MSKKTGQIQFIVFGLLFLAFSIITSIAAISGGVFPIGHDIVLFGVSVMAFCNAYLYPGIYDYFNGIISVLCGSFKWLSACKCFVCFNYDYSLHLFCSVF